MNESSNFTEESGTRHSRWTFLSNATGQLCTTLVGAVQAFTLFYYVAVVGLDATIVAIAMTIFLVYNAVNDPIFGFLIDRNLRFTRKWGRRFPWIVVGIVPWVFSVYIHFSVPHAINGTTNPVAAFGWLLLSLVLLDTFGTLVGINYKAVQVEKFRTEYERRRFTKYYVPFDILAIILGMLLPPLFSEMLPVDPRTGYSIMGLIIAVLALIFGILSFHGNREDKIMIDRYYSPESVKRMNFIKALIEALKTKSFVVYFIFATCLGIQISLVVSNMLFLTTFVLRVGGDMALIILSLYFAGTLISIPIWLRYIRKINDNRKALVVAGLVTCAALIPLTFFVGLYDLMFWAFIFGLAYGGLNSYVYTIISPSVTESVMVKMGKNQKGVIFGVSALLARLVISIDEFIIAFVHDITGFVAGENMTYEKMALLTDMNLVGLGIRLIQGVIPALILLLGVLAIWRFFPLTQERLINNKAKMQELGF